MSGSAPAIRRCDLCRAASTWVYVDPQDAEWHLCRRHYQPIAEWRDDQQRRRQAALRPERTT